MSTDKRRDDTTEKEEEEDVDVDDILDKLEDDLSLAGYREHRLEQLKRQMENARDLREIDHGKYTEITDEKEVIRISAYEKRCVIHFYHRNFQRCTIMHNHLEKIAPKYFQTRFLRVFVENVPWLVEKLAIKVLPCLIVFVDGVTKDRQVKVKVNLIITPPIRRCPSSLSSRLPRLGCSPLATAPSPSLTRVYLRIVGFEEIGNSDDFETAALELRLKSSGVISSTPNSMPTLRSMFTNDETTGSRTGNRGSKDEDGSEEEEGGERRGGRKIRSATRRDDSDDEFDH
ncbi:hypothetical protein FRC19_003259 [Serendipita sp. 401]|nr:hypothetical protein FRC19_003259 [Serendipita sp. 401]